MGLTVGELEVKFDAEFAKLDRGFKSLENQVKGFTTRTDRSLSRLQAASSKAVGGITSLAGALGVGFGATALISGFREAVTELDNIGKQADKLGVTTDALQELRFAAELNGVEIAALDVGLQRFTRRAAEAAQGTGTARGALAELGVAVRDTEGNLRDTDAILADVADGLANTENQADRVRLSFALFDTEGVGLVNLLGQGSEALAEFREEARRVGAVVDETTIREAERLNDQLTALQRGLEGRFRAAFVNFGPVLEGFARGIQDASTGVSLLFDRFKEFEERSSDNLRRSSVELATRRAELEALLAREPGVGATLFPGLFESTRKATEEELARVIAAEERVDAELARRAAPRPEGPPEIPAGMIDDPRAEEAATAAAQLARQQEANLGQVLALERQITEERLRREEPINAELASIAETVRTLQELDLTEEGREQRARVLATLGEEAARLQRTLSDATMEQIGLEIALERELEIARTLDRERADEIERAVRARIAEAVGVEATNEAIQDAIEKLRQRRGDDEGDTEEEQLEAFARTITEGFERGVFDAIRSGSLEDFGAAMGSIVDENLRNTLSQLGDSFADSLASGLQGLTSEGGLLSGLSGLLGGGEGGGGLAAGLGAAVGLGGAVLQGALAGTSSRQSFTDVASAVTSTQEVRGIVAGDTNIPIRQVGETLQTGNEKVVERLDQLVALVAEGVANTRGGLSSGAVDTAVSSDLNGAPSLP